MKLLAKVLNVCCTALLMTVTLSATARSSQTTMQWTKSDYDSVRRAYAYDVTLTGLPSGNSWSVCFSQMPLRMTPDTTGSIRIDVVMASLYKITPTWRYTEGQTAHCRFYAPNVERYQMAPETAFIMGKDGRCTPIKLNVELGEQPDDGVLIYERNSRQTTPEVNRFDIIPSVKSLTRGQGEISLGKVTVSADPDFDKQARYLLEQLGKLGIKVSKSAPTTILLRKAPMPHASQYTINAHSDSITLSAADTDGAFCAAVTLGNIIENGNHTSLEAFSVNDYPDMAYRGTMIDVARNFTTKDNLLKLIDRLALYKVNRIQLHFCDDEGWRIEIKGLPELTEVGAFHAMGDESTAMLPSYDGCFDPTDKKASSNGYYTRKDFVEILKYACSRNIEVIPEVESPGHSRAAIKAMKVRATRLGDNSIMLHDPLDKSKYISAQKFTDNALCVARPSVYEFLDYVMGDLCEMYSEAGLKLKTVHIGGDEVPKGCWLGSPECQAFMAQQGFTTASELQSYFVMRMADICASHDVRMSSWQELPMHIAPENAAQLQKVFGWANCWRTVPDWGNDTVPCTLANRGYNVVLSNVCNTYADLTFSRHRQERGLHWGGTLSTRKSFAL